MAIDTSVPTLRPPSALDLAGGVTSGDGAAPTTTPDPITATGLPPAQDPNLTPFGADQVSRWDIPMVQQATELIDKDIARGRRDAEVALDERHAQRGTVGSSIEDWSMQEMLTNMETERSRRLFDLNREMANTFATDRATSASIGLQAGQFGEQQRQFDVGAGMDQRAQQLQALGMDRDEAYRYASLEQQSGQFGQNLQQRESEFGRQFGLSGQSLDLEVQRLQQQAETEGRTLDIREATSQAEIGLRAQQLQQQAQTEGRSLDLEEARQQAQTEQFNLSLDWQRDQFAQSLGMDQQQLDLQRDEFQAEYADRQTERLHQMGLQDDTQEFAASQNALNRLIESRALDLQKEGLDAETAWRDADRDLQEQLDTRALDLQETGMSLDQAYREAALELDRDNLQFQRDAQQQQAELSQWDIFLRALIGDVDNPDFPNISSIPGTVGYDQPTGPNDPYKPDDPKKK